MSDKFLTARDGNVKAGAVSVSVIIELRSTTGNAPITGLAHTSLTSASYLRQGGLRVAITLSALAAVDSAYSSGGWVELDATNLPGLYRLDVPDAALASGADWVCIGVADAVTVNSALFIGLPTYASLGDALDANIVEVEGSYTKQQVLSILLAVLAGRTSGGGLTIKTPNAGATRVAATTDASKNRTAMTLTPSAA